MMRKHKKLLLRINGKNKKERKTVVYQFFFKCLTIVLDSSLKAFPKPMPTAIAIPTPTAATRISRALLTNEMSTPIWLRAVTITTTISDHLTIELATLTPFLLA